MRIKSSRAKGLLVLLLFPILLAVFIDLSFAATECDPPLGGENQQCCDPNYRNLPCDGMTCKCNIPFVCSPPSDIHDPDPRWRCLLSCGNKGESCCLSEEPSEKCKASTLACYNRNGIRTCEVCGGSNQPCCVVGNKCNSEDLEPKGYGEACICSSETPLPIECGTSGYPCCLTDTSNPPKVIGACNSSDNPCICYPGQGECKRYAGQKNPFYSTVCFDSNSCGGNGQICCTEANESSCDSPSLICVSGFCCLDENPVDGKCDGSNPEEPYKGPIYNGPIIESLEEILNPAVRILYYGGLFVGIFFIILSGYKLMTSEGDPQKTREAQEQLTSAIIGIIFILLSTTIIRIIMSEIIGI